MTTERDKLIAWLRSQYSPPCADCVEHSGDRGLISIVEGAIATLKKAGAK